MIQIQTIRENPEEIITKLKVKNFDASHLIYSIIELDKKIRSTKKLLDENLAQQNKNAKEIGILFKNKKAAEANQLKEESLKLKEEEKTLQLRLNENSKELDEKLILLPNTPHKSVPAGKSAEDNQIIYNSESQSVIPSFLLPHWELIKKYDIIDFDLGNKITGAGFPVYKNKGAKLQRALVNFFLDSAIEEGYTEIEPPYLVNEDSAFATGQLPDKDGQMYHATIDNFYLIPTGEVPVTNIYRDIILKENDFPIKNCAYSACFRREAGSYGKDVRGLNRLHQFGKVEIVQIAHPDHSYQVLEEMKDYVASLLRQLQLPFRIVKLCGGDLSFTSALTYDLEVFSMAQEKWLEVSSVSNFETFQANRLKVRFKDSDGKIRLAHTLNGSALALPRIMAALLENNQTEEGIVIPEILQPYTGFPIIN